MHGSSMHALSSKLDSIIITPQILQTNVLSYKLHLLVLNNITPNLQHCQIITQKMITVTH